MKYRHMPRQNSNDLRSGWERDEAAGIPLNRQQKLAKATHGIVRAPNGLSLLGLSLTVLGATYALHQEPAKATAAIAAGALCDFEGSLARLSGVDDPVWGARVDQSFDFAKGTITVTSLTYAGILPIGAAALAYGPKAVNAVTSLVHIKRHGDGMQTSDAGKLAELCRDTVPVVFLASAIADKLGDPKEAAVLRKIGWADAVTSCAIGTYASIGYIQTALAKPSHPTRA